MTHVKSIIQPHDDAPVGADKGHNSTDSAEITESVHVSDACSQSHIRR
jgi:hypothetical protein